MKLLIIGAGGYGRLVKEIAQLNGYDIIDFLDDNSDLAFGSIDDIERLEPEYDGSIVAIGNPSLREQLFARLKKPVSIIHPMSYISPSATLGAGCVVEAMAVVNTEAVVRDSCFICAGAVVNHNAIVGEFCQIDCNALVPRGAEIPAGSQIRLSQQ